MTEQHALAQPGAPARIYAGMTRLEAVSADRVDRDFEKHRHGPAAYAIGQKMEVGQAGRSLVAAGCIAPDDPRAVAMQEPISPDRVAQMRSAKGLRESAAHFADEIGASDLGREGAAVLHGLRRGLKAEGASHAGIADAFGRLAIAARQSGALGATRVAGEAFATTAQAGVEAARARVASRDRAGEAR